MTVNPRPEIDPVPLASGDLLVQNRRVIDSGGRQYFEHRMYLRIESDGSVTYAQVDLPVVTDWLPGFNSSLQIASAPFPDRRKLYRISGGTSELLWEVGRREYVWIEGIAEDGTIYANLNPGSRPYRVTSTSRQPLTDEPAAGVGWGVVSRAPSGQEEFPITITSTGACQMYQPELNARFVLPVPPNTIEELSISKPIGRFGSRNYAAGYIAYTANTTPNTSFILTPRNP